MTIIILLNWNHYPHHLSSFFMLFMKTKAKQKNRLNANCKLTFFLHCRRFQRSNHMWYYLFLCDGALSLFRLSIYLALGIFFSIFIIFFCANFSSPLFFLSSSKRRVENQQYLLNTLRSSMVMPSKHTRFIFFCVMRNITFQLVFVFHHHHLDHS